MYNKDELIRLTHNANPEVRAAAIRELGLIIDTDFAPVLLNALEDPAWVVRAEAVKSLAKQDTPVVIPALQPRLEDDSVEVRQVTREVIRSLRQKQRAQQLPRELKRYLPSQIATINWPAWMGKVEISFASVASIFIMLWSIRFLIVYAWGDQTTGDVIWNLILIGLIFGLFFGVFVIAGILQVHLRLRDVWLLLKEKPWRRLVEIIFVIDIGGLLISDFFGQIIFLIGLMTGVPLSIAFIASELWASVNKRRENTGSNL